MARSSTKKKATGFMIYSEDYLPIFKHLSKNDGYDLFLALLKYADDSEEPFEEPEFENPIIEGLFETFSRRIDVGRENYIKTCEARSRNARKRWEKEKAAGDQEEYICMHPDTNEGNCNSNSNSNSNDNNNPNNNDNSNTNDNRRRYGAYNNVLLSDDEVDKLKEEFPYDCQSRIEDLSEYMASSGRSYSNHMATIRSWARKESEEPAYSGRRYPKRETVRMVLDDDLPF